MLVVKCKSCGNKYGLDSGESPDNYQCNCGGNLKYTKRHYLSRISLFVLLFVIFFFVGYIGMWILKYNVLT